MSLSFLFHEDVSKIFNTFHALFGIRIAFFSPDGKELKVGNNEGICRYCKAIRMCKGGAASCSKADRDGRILAQKRKKLVIYTCHAGMTEVVKPIIQQGALLGYAMIGQIRTTTLPPNRFSSMWNATHEEKLEDIFLTQPLITQSNLMHIIEMFSYLMDLLSQEKMIYNSAIEAPRSISGFIQNHIDEQLSLERTSREIHLSPSRISHIVKEQYGISYTSLVRKLKMERARFLLTHFPNMSISEVALEVGIPDGQYFSRVFRKESNISPTQYRKQQINPQQ